MCRLTSEHRNEPSRIKDLNRHGRACEYILSTAGHVHWARASVAVVRGVREEGEFRPCSAARPRCPAAASRR
eukprot:451425-Pleurochrysis_carterae.AAC.1